MLRSIGTWLNAVPFKDPVQRRQAVLLQILLIALLAGVAIAMIGNVFIFGASALTPAGILPNLIFGLIVAGLLLMLRRGYFAISAIVLLAALLLGAVQSISETGVSGATGA